MSTCHNSFVCILHSVVIQFAMCIVRRANLCIYEYVQYTMIIAEVLRRVLKHATLSEISLPETELSSFLRGGIIWKLNPTRI
jgi:hypothetical protein